MTSISHLRCEYAAFPLGIDIEKPRLNWLVQSDRRGARQTAYQILVARDPETLKAQKGDLWDSGKVESDQSVHVVYGGPALGSGERAWWTVRVWDEAGEATADTEPAWWETGLLQRSDWKGEWIGSSLTGGPRTTIPCPYLRAAFTLDKPVASAKLYATALGLYECFLNGKRVGEDELAPGWTDYRKRVQYQAHDVTDLLRTGGNAWGAVLGDGWYCGHIGWCDRQRYGGQPRLLAQIQIQYEDGTSETLATGGAWKTSFGPLLESDMLMGESYDARLEQPHWDTFDFDASGWHPVQTFDDPGLELTAMHGPPVRVTQEITPISDPIKIDRWGQSDHIFDLGQNMVGRVRLKIKGPRGATVRLRYAEVLKDGPNVKEGAGGGIYTENLRPARQTDYYTLKGGGEEEVYESHFTFHGFRYVELSGLHEAQTRETITGVVLHSDTPRTGTFECSDPLISQLQQNIDWGQRGNFLDIPTDCPQRDERLGWTGDAQVFIRTAAFNRDVAGFFTKWLQTMTDEQAPDGGIPCVIPNTGVLDNGADGKITDGGPAWADAAVICPWTVYLCYGDTRLLEERYDMMVRFVGYMEHTSRDGLRCSEGADYYTGFGDWLALDGSGKTEGGTPKELLGTAFYAYSARLLSRIARVLGKTEDAERYAGLFEQAKRAFIHQFVTPSGLIAAQTQTASVLALHFDLLPEELRPVVADALVRDIKARGIRLSTGFVSSHYLPHVLTQAGHIDTAYALLHQTQWPSWLYAVTQGATTIWERWDGWTHDKGFQDAGMNSFNHYAYGAVGDWLYSNVAGIDLDPERPAYKHSLLHPRPGGQLTSARAAFDSVYGRIVSDWRLTDSTFAWNVTVPPNTTATLTVPGAQAEHISEGGRPARDAQGLRFVRQDEAGAVFEAVAGTYQFSAPQA